MTDGTFPDRDRIDGRDKVRGVTAYAADVTLPELLHAMTVPATIAKGRVVAMATDAAMAVPGVVRVLTAGDFPAPPAAGGPPPPPTLNGTVAYRGEPVALVVAETLEAAIEGARLVRPDYEAEEFVVTIDGPGVVREPGQDTVAGDAEAALAGAATTITASYETPIQHHNPIELLSTTAIWSGGRLTIYEGSQSSDNLRNDIAAALGLDRAIVEVKSPSVGGSFGQKVGAQRHSPLVARAAILTGRPVKLVVPRGQVFHTAFFRPVSRHTIRLGANDAGRMFAARYEVEHLQSRTGRFDTGGYHHSPSRLYGIENYLGTGADYRVDTQAPGAMRGPHEHPACFAFESTVDELAYALGQDPVAFRRANDTAVDPIAGQPLSSRFLNECLAQGAERFGWSRRTPAPGSMAEPDGTQVGWGVASGAHPTLVTAAIATLRVGADGRTRFATSGHEMGQGMRTAIAAVLLRELDIDEAGLEIAIGDTSAAPQQVTAGGWGTASTVPVTLKAAESLRDRMTELLAGRTVAGNLHEQLAAIGSPSLSVEVSQVGPGQGADTLEELRAGGFTLVGPEYPEFTTMSYIAHFVEVRIEPRTRRIRVPRVVSVVDCGRVVSPRTAASQVRGGVVWGIGAALREETEVDPRFGGFLNADLADYVVPVNADVAEIDVRFIDQPDPLVNTIGAKTLGILSIVGVSAAIANAVYHATGKRLRKLPIRIDDLL